MAEVKILSFDPGTANMGWAFLQGDTKTKYIEATEFFGVQKTSIDDGNYRARIDILGEWLESMIVIHKPTHISIEDFTEQGVRTGTVYKEMATLIEHMRMVSRFMGYKASILENAEWKKIATGSKGLNKDQVKHFVTHKVPKAKELYQGRTATHVWDACGIGYAEFKRIIRGEQ